MMQFETIFLEKTAQQKIALLSALCRQDHPGITIADLAEQLGFTYQRTYNLFQELNADLAELYHQTPDTMRQHLVDNAHMAVSLNRYTAQQFQNAPAWQFFDYLVQGHQPNLDHFCANHFLSRSTLMRKTAALRQFLAHYQIKLLYPTMQLVGTEACLRLLLQQCYWQATHGSSWPFTAIAEGNLRHQYEQFPRRHTSPLAQHMDLYLLAVSRIRMAQGHALEHQIAQLLPDVNAYFTASQFPHLTAAQLVFENQFVAFHQICALRYGRIDLSAWTKRKQRLIAATPMAATIFTHVRQDLLNPDEPGYISLQTNLGLQLNLLRVLACFLSLGQDYCKASDFDPPHKTNPRINRLSLRITSLVDSLPDTAEYAVLHRASGAFCRLMCYVLTPYLNAGDSSVRLRVAVVLEQNDRLNRHLEDFLDNLSFVDRLVGPQAIPQCDFLIAEAGMLLDPQTQAFTANYPEASISWGIDADQVDYHHLFQKLSALHDQRLVALTACLSADA